MLCSRSKSSNQVGSVQFIASWLGSDREKNLYVGLSIAKPKISGVLSYPAASKLHSLTQTTEVI
jgi:catabolite regulation protein CreA